MLKITYSHTKKHTHIHAQANTHTHERMHAHTHAQSHILTPSLLAYETDRLDAPSPPPFLPSVFPFLLLLVASDLLMIEQDFLKRFSTYAFICVGKVRERITGENRGKTRRRKITERE